MTRHEAGPDNATTAHRHTPPQYFCTYYVLGYHTHSPLPLKLTLCAACCSTRTPRPHCSLPAVCVLLSVRATPGLKTRSTVRSTGAC